MRRWRWQGGGNFLYKWQQFINSSEDVVDGAFTNDDTGTVPTAVPTTVQVIVTSTPIPGSTAAGQGSTESLPPNSPRTYTIVAGDTLNKISRQFGVTLEALRQANGIPANVDRIQAGDQLIIPAK